MPLFSSKTPASPQVITSSSSSGKTSTSEGGILGTKSSSSSSGDLAQTQAEGRRTLTEKKEMVETGFLCKRPGFGKAGRGVESVYVNQYKVSKNIYVTLFFSSENHF